MVGQSKEIREIPKSRPLALPQEDLSVLELLFTEEEVWSVIVDMPNDKAPGPDGFN